MWCVGVGCEILWCGVWVLVVRFCSVVCGCWL